MAKKVPWARRVGYIIAILAFLITAPILIYYTQGYRFNRYKEKIEPKGILIVETTPKNTKIFLNDQYLDTAPFEKNDLRPGTYDLKLAYDNYFDWKKIIEIKAKETTIINKIKLFPQNFQDQAMRKLPASIITPLLSSDQKLIALITNDEKNKLPQLIIYNLDSRSSNLIYKFKTKNETAPLKFISFSPNNKFLLLTQEVNKQNHYLIFNLKQPGKLINFIWENTKDEPQWLYNDEALILQAENGIIFTNTLDGTRQNILTLKNQNALLSFYHRKGTFANSIYYLEKDNVSKNVLLNKLDLGNQKISLISSQLPKSDNYKIIQIIDGKILVLNDQKQTLYLIPLEAETIAEPVEEISKVKNLIIDDAKNAFFYYNDLELWHYDLGLQTKKLINRYGDEIKAISQKSTQYLLVRHGNFLDAIDWENSGNQWKLLELEENGIWWWQEPQLMILEPTAGSTLLKINTIGE